MKVLLGILLVLAMFFGIAFAIFMKPILGIFTFLLLGLMFFFLIFAGEDI